MFVARTDVAETFEEVLQIAVDVHEFSKSEQVMEAPVSAAQDSETESTDGEQSEQQEQTEAQVESSEDQPNTQGGASSSGGADLEDVRDDWYDEDGNLTEPEEEGSAGSQGGDTSETQRAFDSAASTLSSRHYGRDTKYIEISDKVDIDNHVVDCKVLHSWIDSQQHPNPEVYEETDGLYNEFRKKSQKEVNYLVKEFECRKSADAYARAGQSKTGVLDTSKLHTYRYNEDIFKKVTILPDGKNHGLLFVLDWSGSMANELLATVKQVLNLTAFCKKVQIPFEVYAFTNDWYPAQRAMDIEEGKEIDYDSYHHYPGIEKNKIYIDSVCSTC
ncbi:MAG: hypothetical protein CM15mV3_1280 [Caudoviricetes sp.]|nr:MAG: hypothetical protein CM15mV3_1280 [Caudoviricetes sp.]